MHPFADPEGPPPGSAALVLPCHASSERQQFVCGNSPV